MSDLKISPAASLQSPPKAPCLWIVEDDEGCNVLYEEILHSRYPCRTFKSLREFKQALSQLQHKHQLVLADVGLPDGCFLDFISRLPKAQMAKLKIFMVSSCDELSTIRSSFRDGAVDYLTKPFNTSELLIKVERCLEHVRKANQGLSVDPLRRRVSTKNNLETELTSKELMIFNVINSSSNHKISRSDLIRSVWKDVSVGAKTLDVHIFNMRRKLSKLNVRILYTQPQTYSIVTDPKVPTSQL